MNLWQLPTRAVIGDVTVSHESDFRKILTVLALLGDESRPQWLRWHMALHLFYRDPIPRALEGAAMAYLADFLTCGQPGAPGPKLLDWQQDAAAIIADVNAVAGREIRQETYLHWWSFLSFFHGIREGQLSNLVTIRDKLRRGKKLEPWEQEFYRAHKDQVRLRTPETPEEAARKRELERLVGGFA